VCEETRIGPRQLYRLGRSLQRLGGRHQSHTGRRSVDSTVIGRLLWLVDPWHRTPSIGLLRFGTQRPRIPLPRKTYADTLLSVPGTAFNVVCGIFIKRL
jgi:hypothetical protein